MKMEMKTRLTPTLYETTDEMIRIHELLLESEGELTPEIERALVMVEAHRLEKIERICKLRQRMKDRILVKKAEEKRLKEERIREERACDGLERYLVQEMRRADEKSVQTNLYRVSRAKSPRPQITANVAPENLPTELTRWKPAELRMDADAVLDFLKNRGLVPEEPCDWQEIEGLGISVRLTEGVRIK